MSLEDLQAQLRGALEQQFAALKQHYESATEEARRQAAAEAHAEAERRVAQQLEALQAELAAKLQAMQAESAKKLESLESDFASRLDADVAVAREDAERDAISKLHAIQADFTARREAEVAAAREQMEQHSLGQLHAMQTAFLARREADVAAARAKAEQQAAEAIALQRQELEERVQQQVAEQMEQALASARRTAELEIESERRRAGKELEAERQHAVGEIEEARQRATELEAEHQRARAELDAERSRVAEIDALRAQAQAELATAREQMQAELQAELAAARERAQTELEAERQRGQNEIQAERERAKNELEAQHQAAAAEIDALRERSRQDADELRARMDAELAAAHSAIAESAQQAAGAPAGSGLSSAAFDRVGGAIRDLDGARTLSQALESLLNHARSVAGRAALFLINGDRLKAWKAAGIPDVDAQTVESSIGGKDLLARAIQLGQATPSGAELPAPPFARLPPDRTGVAVPLMIGGRAVAVLYADGGTTDPSAEGFVDAVDLLVRHASAVIALRTAMRTLDVVSGGSIDAPGNGDGTSDDAADDQGARRYARLLVSEIKLYNEAAVRAGRQQRDLLQRLRPEIDRAQRLYEERIPAAVGSRHLYFQQELVQTLADGDPGLLGNL
jgi:hypothetical protein